MKATEPGMIVGFALEPYGLTNSEFSNSNFESILDESNSNTQIMADGDGTDLAIIDDSVNNSGTGNSPETQNSELEIGKILVFVNVGYHFPEYAENLQLALGENGQTLSWSASLVNVVKGAWHFVVGKLTAKQIEVEEGIIIKDRITGEQYCVVIENGELVKHKGNCDELNAVDKTNTSGDTTTTTESNQTSVESSATTITTTSSGDISNTSESGENTSDLTGPQEPDTATSTALTDAVTASTSEESNTVTDSTETIVEPTPGNESNELIIAPITEPTSEPAPEPAVAELPAETSPASE